MRTPVVLAAASLMVVGPLTHEPAAAAPPSPTPPPGAASGWKQDPGKSAKEKSGGAENPSVVPEGKRAELLGDDYRRSGDRAWTTTGDATGFHLLVADEKSGYRWKTAATLSEEGFDTDLWVGNACVTGDGTRAVVTYAPRAFTNKPQLMARGAFAATVNLGTGQVTKLPHTASLAYFSPGCGVGDKAVLSQFSDEVTSEKNETRLIPLDARTGKTGKPVKLRGQVTSAVPAGDGYVAADGPRLVRITGKGERAEIARTLRTPFQLIPDADGGVTFLDRSRGTAKKPEATGYVKRLDARAVEGGRGGKARRAAGAPVTTLAEGPLTKLDLAAAANGKVFITGKAATRGKLPKAVLNPGGIDKDAQVSTRGRATVKAAWADGKDSRIRPEEALSSRAARIEMRHLATGRKPVFEVDPSAEHVSPAPDGQETSPALRGGADDGGGMRTQLNIGESEDERTCAVERGNPRKQAFQPTPRQIEWAVNQAITGNLDRHASRPANWKNMGMGAYSPQALAGGLTRLSGGGRIPAQVMLGITAQESNMWQATRYAAPGVTANPLIGNYYGVKHDPGGNTDDPWKINFPAADCGYGVTQVTDGMRLPGKRYENGTVRPALPQATQEAIALDYTANIAFGVNILAEKWNQLHAEGMTVNDGDPLNIESWYMALWAYNSGFHPKSKASSNGGKWGLGWTNNPAMPWYKANRTPFLEGGGRQDDYSHAARPQYWPYQEKVLGWAARPISAMTAPGEYGPGYRAAWWTNELYRSTVKPPEETFCHYTVNECDPNFIGRSDPDDPDPSLSPCQRRSDWRCWWTEPVQWKYCDKRNECGFELLRFDSTYPEQPDANPFPRRCSPGLPSGSVVVDNVDNGQPLAGSPERSCGSAAKSDGSFSFRFSKDSARIDTHQLGAGYGNHLWFSNTVRVGSPDSSRMVTGTWTGPTSVKGWTRVLVHMPEIAARSQQATYQISGTDSTSPKRVAPQRTRENTWVSLGVFNFTGTPKVSLSNLTREAVPVNIAWDAIAFQKLGTKPKHVVGFGDSYASGEGATEGIGADYFPETDYVEDVGTAYVRNDCHRSRKAWIRQASLPGMSGSIGDLSDDFGDKVDLSFLACSGARTYNVKSGGIPQSSGKRESRLWKDGVPTSGWKRWAPNSLPQLDLGYLDQNTDLVTISIGGNDSRFTDVFTACLKPGDCRDATLDAKDPDSDQIYEDRKTAPLKDYAPAWMRDEVRPRITSVLEQIRKRAPNAKVVLMGYPALISGECLAAGSVTATVDLPWLAAIGLNAKPFTFKAEFTLTEAERRWLDETLAPELSRQMAQAAKDAGAVFVDPAREFAGRGVCGADPAIHGLLPVTFRAKADDLPGMHTFHPNIAGARLYADALERGLR
ncbi:GDSL-type esterase/lipase family protein [Streptomyces alkaliterrae]|nr:GDSL-type esterase/lipase family protein [Streptomyces alkaliterrae]